MGFLVSAFQEVRYVEPLAHQPPLHVDKADQNGVNFARCSKIFQSIE